MRIIYFLFGFCFLPALISIPYATSEIEYNFLDQAYRIQAHNPITYFTDVYVRLEFDVFSMVDCACNCAQDITCQAFFLSPNQDIDLPYHCSILSAWIGKAFFSLRNGISGTAQDLSVASINFQSPPDMYKHVGDLNGIRKTNAGISVDYDLSQRQSKMTTLGILFDEENDKWPDLTPACLAQLKYQAGLSGTYLKITQTPTQASEFMFSVEIVCPFLDDIHHGDAQCEGLTGLWTLTGDLNVGCVSSQCYRYNGIEHAIYNGVQSETVQGITCQRWDSHEPHPHIMTAGDFPLDDYNLTKAENYCRDPDGEGFPWCYQITGKRWEYCEIPICRL